MSLNFEVLSFYYKIYLKSNEQITFVTDNFSKHDVTRKKWGFYGTQSVNSRLNKKLLKIYMQIKDYLSF